MLVMTMLVSSGGMPIELRRRRLKRAHDTGDVRPRAAGPSDQGSLEPWSLLAPSSWARLASSPGSGRSARCREGRSALVQPSAFWPGPACDRGFAAWFAVFVDRNERQRLAFFGSASELVDQLLGVEQFFILLRVSASS